MADPYVSPHTMPTPRERELLTILMEECGEVIVAASKLLRFGADDGYPGEEQTNRQSLCLEAGDVMAAIEMVADAGLFSLAAATARKPHKKAKVERFLQSAPDKDSAP